MCRRSQCGYILLIAFVTLGFLSCQKEVNNQDDQQPGGGTPTTPTTSILGEWNFLGMSGTTKDTINANYGGQQVKVIVDNGFATKNNAGTIAISDSQFVSSGITYSIDTTVHAIVYLDDSLYGETDTVFATMLPPTGGVTAYTRNSNDSLTFANGFVIPAEPLAGGTSGPVGARIGWSGDTLLLHVTTHFTRAVSQDGIPGILNGTLRGTIKLKKR